MKRLLLLAVAGTLLIGLTPLFAQPAFHPLPSWHFCSYIQNENNTPQVNCLNENGGIERCFPVDFGDGFGPQWVCGGYS